MNSTSIHHIVIRLYWPRGKDMNNETGVSIGKELQQLRDQLDSLDRKIDQQTESITALSRVVLHLGETVVQREKSQVAYE